MKSNQVSICILFLILISFISYGQQGKHPVEYQLFNEKVRTGVGIYTLGESSICILQNKSLNNYNYQEDVKELPVEILKYFKVRKKKNFMKGALLGMGVGFIAGMAYGYSGCTGKCSGGIGNGVFMGGIFSLGGAFTGGISAKSYLNIPINGSLKTYKANRDKLIPYILD